MVVKVVRGRKIISVITCSRRVEQRWVRGHIWPALLTRIVRSPPVNIVGVFGVEGFLQTLGLIKIKLFVRLERAGKYSSRKGAPLSDLFTISIEFHSLLNILLISPVRMVWLAAETWGRLRRAKIMNAFMGRRGVPSELSD